MNKAFNLALPGRNGGVPADKLGEDTSQGLNTEGKWGDVKEQDVRNRSRQDTSLRKIDSNTFNHTP